MTNDGWRGDPTTELIESFVDTNRAELNSRCVAILTQACAPLGTIPTSNLRKQKAFDRLSSCREKALSFLRGRCARRSMDFWLAHVRRLPGIAHWSDAEWIPYATLAILKWSAWSEDTHTRSLGKQGVLYALDEEDLFDCCVIASLGRLISYLNNASRWVGKGASIAAPPNHSMPFYLDIPYDVGIAVQHYERRRPDQGVLADEGLHVRGVLPDFSAFLDRPLIQLGALKSPNNRALVGKARESYPITYFPCPLSDRTVLEALSPYQEAIEDVFRTPLAAIMQVLHAVSTLVIHTLPGPKEDDDIIFEEDLTNEDFAHRFGFLIDLCRKGFVRFPEDHLRERLSQVITFPWSESSNAAGLLVDVFFRRLCLRHADRNRIDVARLEPLPIAYASPDGQCYFDFLWIKDFLRWLIVRSREWFSSQHGDRFTLALKKLVEREVPDAHIVAEKTEFRDSDGNRSEVDLLIHKGRVAYAVECKAFVKSRDFWLGSPKATTRRTNRIREAVKQAIKTGALIEKVVPDKHGRIPPTEKVEWVLCLPSQEYLNPIERYGLLVDGIPRVCTPEELIAVLRR